MSTLCMELMEMADNKSIDYSLKSMECPCGGGMASPTFIDVTYKFDGKAILVKNVPVLKCPECGEIYNDALISIQTEKQAYKAMQESKTEIEF